MKNRANVAFFADMREQFVIDPLISKRQQLLLATQLCRMVLKVRIKKSSSLFCNVSSLVALHSWVYSLSRSSLPRSPPARATSLSFLHPLHFRICSSIAIRGSGDGEITDARVLHACLPRLLHAASLVSPLDLVAGPRILRSAPCPLYLVRVSSLLCMSSSN
jgi:hypothetical protein